MERDWYVVVGTGTCPECGLDVAAPPIEGLGAALVAEADAWSELLAARPDAALRRRPSPSGWSALECACHVRDVLGNFADRTELVLAEDDPTFGWWDHEAAVDDERYGEQDPAVVADELVDAAARLDDVLAGVADGEWSRSGVRRPGERFTVDGLARFALHEAHHHRRDAELALAPRT